MRTFTKAFVIWRLALLRLFLYCSMVAFSEYTSAMHGQKWSALDIDDKIILLMGIYGSVVVIIIAFLDNTVKNLASGDDLPPGVESIATVSSVVKTGNVETATQTQQIKTQNETQS